MRKVNAVRPAGGGGRHVGFRWQWSALVAVGAIGAVAFTNLIDFGAYHLRYRILNANSAASWSHGVVAAALGAGAVVCLAGAMRRSRQRAAWLVIAAILGLLFVDEISGLHANIDALSSANALGYGKLLYAPILIALVVCISRLRIASRYVTSLWAGAGLLLTSYVIHVLNPHDIGRHLGWGSNSWAFQTLVALKEGTELAGLLLVLLVLCGSAFSEPGERGGRGELEGATGA